MSFQHNPRLVTENDKKKLEKFYNDAYGKKHIFNNPDHYNWQFKKNPFNKSQNKTIAITETNNEISSHMGFFPIELKIFDDIKDATWHLSFYTLEKYRGLGLGTELVLFSSNLFNLSMVLNGSDGTKNIYLKNGGVYFGQINRYIGILDKKRIENYIKIAVNKEQVIVKEIQEKASIINALDYTYETFWKKVKQKFPITTNRTKEYLSWRYLNHPIIKYHFITLSNENELVGYAVLRFEDNNEELKAARIVDFIVLDSYENQMLQGVINYCHKKADFIDFFCTGDFYKKELVQNKFFNNLTENIKIPTVFNPIDPDRRPDIDFFYRINDNDLLKNKKLDDINNWYFVKGDSDQDRAN